MPWPLSQDYNEAVQNPQTTFGDPELRGGQVVTNALGIPVPRSGNFADVYEFIGASGAKWAIKCFTRAVPDQCERYAAISAQLQEARLPFTVEFQYLERGIRVAGEWYPVLKMDWVEGFLLNEFVRQNLDRPAMLDALSNLWSRLAGRLRRAGIAHGDLQHGNVLLVPGRDETRLAIKLIDYDGMYVPALAGLPSGEVGHPAYQHPQRRREATYNVDIDRFPIRVIIVAIRALMVGGRALWDRYDDGDNLLFRRQDLEAPSKSALFAELLKLNEPGLRVLVEMLIDAARKPLAETPLIDGARTLTPVAAVTAPAAVAPLPEKATPAPLVSPQSPVEGPAGPAVATPAVTSLDPGTSAPSELGPKTTAMRRQLPKWTILGGGIVSAVIATLLVAVFWHPRADQDYNPPDNEGPVVVNPPKSQPQVPAKPSNLHRLDFKIQPTTTEAGKPFTVTIRALDETGALLVENDLSVTLAVASNSAGASLNGKCTATALHGIVTFNDLSIVKSGAGYKLDARCDGVARGTSEIFEIVPCAPNRVFFVEQPANANAGEPQAIAVKVEDRYGNSCSGSVTIKVTDSASNENGVQLNGMDSEQAAANAGIARIKHMSIKKSGRYRLKVGVGGKVGYSEPFDITPAAADRLAFEQQPSDTVAGKHLPTVAVKIMDRFGNLRDDPVVLTITDKDGNENGAKLQNYEPANARDGIAKFERLLVTTAGSFRLKAMTGDKASHSTEFNVKPAKTALVEFSTQPKDTAAGKALTIVVRVWDAYKNACNDRVTLEITNMDGDKLNSVSLQGFEPKRAIDGVAKFEKLWIKKAGRQYCLVARAVDDKGMIVQSSITSIPFDVEPGPRDHLAFVGQPRDAVVDEKLNVEVELRDQYDNVLLSGKDRVILELRTASFDNAKLSREYNPFQQASAGKATFSEVRVPDVPDGEYRLLARADSYGMVFSDVFRIKKKR
jgi:hypothetical protein